MLTVAPLFSLDFNPIIWSLFILVLGVIVVAFYPLGDNDTFWAIGISSTSLAFYILLFLWLGFDINHSGFQFPFECEWIPQFNLSFSLGVDGIALPFILLSALLIPLCLIMSYNVIQQGVRIYVLSFLVLDILLILVFAVKDLLLFYICFESVLVPMVIMIGVWGSRPRKIRAAYMFFMYTLFGSLLMLSGILYIFQSYGTTAYESLLTVEFSPLEERLLWLVFFISFASKVPMLPFHIWLPEAHVEAPTSGSVILAGVLLKLGTYGLIRYSLPIFPDASKYFAPAVIAIAIAGVIYPSLVAIRQSDLKRVIAYTSVAHMNLVVIGIFSFNPTAVEGAILQSISHGFVSSALFFIIGVVYDRHHTRLIKFYSGLAHPMPLFAILFFFFSMANIALPMTSSFVGEFYILAGIFKVNIASCFGGATGMILGGAYSLWLLNRIIFGNLEFEKGTIFTDINAKEFFVFFPLVFGTLFVGIYPDFIIQITHPSVMFLLSVMHI